MTSSPNKLSKFWQELKRRKVTRVITVYAAASFVILQLIEILAPSLRLPEWTMNLILVLLIVGFIIAVILSWIYDIHPEEGIVKTEQADKVKTDEIPTSSNGWKIASYISFVVIVALILVNVIPRSNRDNLIRNLEKSIAVLPFTNLTSEEDFAHIGIAFCDEVIMELQKIKSFDRVLSFSSTMQYAENRPTIPEIGEELNVNYIVEGTIQKHGDEVSINVQVIRAKHEDHIWADEYDEKWIDIYTVQDEIALKVASELKVILSPEEQERIEKTPSTNPLAHDAYQRGKDQLIRLRNEGFDRETIEKGESFFKKAIMLDHTYAKAYTGLAWTYLYKNALVDISSENYMDSLLILADSALFYDKQLAEAHTIKGVYHNFLAQPEKALEEFDKAIDLNPNDWRAYENKGILFLYRDPVKSLDNLYKAANLNLGEGLYSNLLITQSLYAVLGSVDAGVFYAQRILKLTEDSAKYFNALAEMERNSGDYKKAIYYFRKMTEIDASNSMDYSISWNAFMLRKFEMARKYYRRYFETTKDSPDSTMHIFDYSAYGYLLWEEGYPEQAKKYFDEHIKYHSKIVELGGRSTLDAYTSHAELAMDYAFLDDKVKAFEHLRLFNQTKLMFKLYVVVMKDSPLFDNIRDEPEFQQILQEVEAKYQANHEQVRQWIEENDIL